MTVRLRNKQTGVIVSVPEDLAASLRKGGYAAVRGKASKPTEDVTPDPAAGDAPAA